VRHGLPLEPIDVPSVDDEQQEDSMAHSGKSLADRKAQDMQAEGTREFEEAIAGSGPTMPPKHGDHEADSDLTKALKDTFPASDPVAATSSETKPGAPSKPRRQA